MGADSLLNHSYGVVIFDTQCLLCNRFVRILLKNDQGRLRYTGFESNFSHSNLPEYLVQNPETVVFLDHDKMLNRSEAVFAILRRLGLPYRLLTVFSIIPVSVSDRVYNWVARNRHNWFGRSKDCFLPTEEQKSRFLD